jgi:GAF domain-containing protein
VATVPPCQEASIAILDAGSPLLVSRSKTPASPAVEAAREALATQLVVPGGPLSDVLNYREPHRIGDTATDHRWPTFAAAAMSAGYRSCLLLPLPSRGDAAAFTLMSAEPDAFSETSYDVVLLFALHAGVVFDNVQLFDDCKALVAQLQTALGTRALIARAQGILMHRYDIDATVAFEVMARGSQTANVKLRDLANDLVEYQEKGELSAALARYGIITSPEDDELTP